jgi:hypothetical protein
MQNRYAADIGDYVKLALLRQLSVERKLGICWYLYPDEGHNKDGKHVDYLKNPDRWRHLDADLFDSLRRVINTKRSVRALEKTGLIGESFSSQPLESATVSWSYRANWRLSWFNQVLNDLQSADIVFADPDNGLIDDNPKRRGRKQFGKQMPISEAKTLAAGRTAVIYHHNTRFKGGHSAEIEHWLSQLGDNAMAIKANAYSCRTFFILNPDQSIRDRIGTFCDRWSGHSVSLHHPQ